MNRRVNITYSINEEEFGPELASSVSKAGVYMSEAIEVLKTSILALEARDYASSMVHISKMRDSLAFADYRLHDIMTMVASYESATKTPSEQAADSGTSETNVAHAAHKMQNFEERLRLARENIAKLGLQVSDDELESMLEAANDSAS